MDLTFILINCDTLVKNSKPKTRINVLFQENIIRKLIDICLMKYFDAKMYMQLFTS